RLRSAWTSAPTAQSWLTSTAGQERKSNAAPILGAVCYSTGCALLCRSAVQLAVHGVVFVDALDIRARLGEVNELHEQVGVPRGSLLPGKCAARTGVVCREHGVRVAVE